MSKEEATTAVAVLEKPFYKTSEFWGSIFLHVLGLAMIIAGSMGESASGVMEILGMVANIASKLGYDVTRSRIKVGGAQAKAMLMSSPVLVAQPIDPTPESTQD